MKPQIPWLRVFVSGVTDYNDLLEVAVALTAAGAVIMVSLRYEFGGTVIEVTPTTTVAEVNGALAQSNTIVLFAGGTYTGDLSFSGSNVTLFGAGDRGGQVTLTGSVVMGGSNNRIRGTTITSGLDISGSGFGFSFSRLVGALSLPGSGATLFNNEFCGSVAAGGSGTVALGNAGLDPVPAPADCP